MGYILALDVGTTAIKAVIVDEDTRAVYMGKKDCPIYHPGPNMTEQDPQEIWDCLCQASRLAAKSAREQIGEAVKPEAMVIAAPWKHIIALDKDNKVLRPSMIWMDARGIDQARRINEMMGEFIGSGQEYWPRLLWFKENEPDIWQEAARIVGLNTYLKFRVTGEFATEPSDDFIHSPNKKLEEKYQKILHLTGLDADTAKFPAWKRSTEKVGEVTAEAAPELGIEPGIPVFGGFGDLCAVSYGCGCSAIGDTHIYLGTSGWHSVVYPDRIPGTGRGYFTQDVGLEGAMVTTMTTVGRGYDWAIDRFYGHERETLGDGVYKLVNDEIAAIPAGSDKLIVTHWLNGEAPPLTKKARALFFNVDEHHDRRYFVRALLESVCYTIRRNFEPYAARQATPPDHMRVVGGGAMNPVWMQIMADVLKVRIEIPENPRFCGTMGSFYCAEVGLGKLKEYPREVRICKTYEPNPDNFAVYDKLFKIYCDLYPALEELYEEI